MSAKPTPYTEIAEVLDQLPILLHEARRARGLSVRAAAREIGCSFATVNRIELGEDCVIAPCIDMVTDGGPDRWKLS